MKCDYCGNQFEIGNRPDGLPNGITMVLKDGRKTTMCADCIIKIGMMTPKEVDTFLDSFEQRAGEGTIKLN